MSDTLKMRRTNTSKRTYNGNGSHPNGMSLEEAETGQASAETRTKNGHDRRPGRRRRRKVRKGGIFSLTVRRMSLALRQSPHRYHSVLAGVFGIVICLYMLRMIFLQRLLEEPERQLTTRIVKDDTTALSKPLRDKRKPVMPQKPQRPFEILFKGLKAPDEIAVPGKLGPEEEDEGLYVDYGGLEMTFLEYDDEKRNILHDYKLFETNFRPPDADRDDDLESYYAFDDDGIRSDIGLDSGDEASQSDLWCRRISEQRLTLQNCNNFHEFPLLEYNMKYLGAGAYRQVLMFDNAFGNRSEKVTIKDLHYTYDFDHESYENARADAIVAERLTASPRIYDIYGFCGMGIMSEFFPHGDMEDVAVTGEGNISPDELHDEFEVQPQNELTGLEKLEISLKMAEAIADLHGYPGGVIVHQDIQLSQFLWTEDKSMVKLNDFNRAEFMLWDQKGKDYCPYHEGPGNGNWRSAEEYYDKALTEQVDVFSFGNNMYSLLTGLYPFYDEEDMDRMQERVKHGEMAFIDPRWQTRSVAEGKLVEVIEKCYAYEPRDRPSIFEVVHMLRAGLNEVKAARTG